MSQRPTPRAVGKPNRPPPLLTIDPVALRESWTLDVMAWLQLQRVAPRIDLHGARSPLPPVVLDLPDAVWALDLWPAVAALQSRPRSFSQVAGRYAPIAVGARGKALHLQWWDLRGEADAVKVGPLAEALGRYLQADVRLMTLADRDRMLQAHAARGEAWPSALLERNPLAWQLQVAGG